MFCVSFCVLFRRLILFLFLSFSFSLLRLRFVSRFGDAMRHVAHAHGGCRCCPRSGGCSCLQEEEGPPLAIAEMTVRLREPGVDHLNVAFSRWKKRMTVEKDTAHLRHSRACDEAAESSAATAVGAVRPAAASDAPPPHAYAIVHNGGGGGWIGAWALLLTPLLALVVAPRLALALLLVLPA
jgi:hypothetical protein